MRSENSGLIDLDALMKEASAPELPKSADASDSLEAVTTAPASLPEPEPPPPPAPPPAPPPTPTPTLPSVTAPTVASAPTSPSRMRPTPRPAKPHPVVAPRRKSRLPWVGVALTVGAIAFLVGFRRPQDRPTAPPVAGATPSAPSTESPAAPLATGISLDSLPAPVEAAPSASASAASPIAIAPRLHAPAPGADPSAKLVAIADEPPPSAGDLGGAMREAVGARNAKEPSNVDSTPAGSARQLRPSPGAVVGAINSVLPEARACLLTEDEPARPATIVFRSDGTVARVDLAGPSRLNDECIRTALSKARTMPFVEDTFAARATVRP